MKETFVWLLDNWRERVVPFLWAAFAAGVLLTVSAKVDNSLATLSSRSSMDLGSREYLRQDVKALASNRVPLLEEWLRDQPVASEPDDKGIAASVIKYLQYDRGLLALLGDNTPLRIRAWGDMMRHRIGVIHPVAVLSLLLVIFFGLSLKYRRRIWSSLSYFTSRTMLFTIYAMLFVGLVTSIGSLWLMGSAAARLTSLPALTPLWVVVLSSGQILSQIVKLLIVLCIGSMVEAIFPDP